MAFTERIANWVYDKITDKLQLNNKKESVKKFRSSNKKENRQLIKNFKYKIRLRLSLSFNVLYFGVKSFFHILIIFLNF